MTAIFTEYDCEDLGKTEVICESVMKMGDDEISMPCDWEMIIEDWPELKDDPMWDNTELDWIH